MSGASFDAVAQRLRARLKARRGHDVRSDQDLNGGRMLRPDGAGLRDAAVLIAVVDRPGGPQLLFTERAAHLKRHAGQVAFPGGRVDPSDQSAEAAALREAQEEVGLAPGDVDVLGRLAPYETVTGFRVQPVVGLVRPRGPWRADPQEVADIFEAPFDHVMNPAHHEIRSAEWKGATRRYYAIPYDTRFIWGATAGMLIEFHRTVFDEALAP